MTRYLFLIIGIIIFSVTDNYGQISITTEPSLPGSGVGTGSVHVVADGTAGPFQLVLTAPIDFAVADNIQGSFTYRNVPAGLHRLRVTDRYDCQTWYDVIVEEGECDLDIILLSLTAPELCETVTGEGCDEGAISVTSSVDPSQITFTWTAQTYIGDQVYRRLFR